MNDTRPHNATTGVFLGRFGVVAALLAILAAAGALRLVFFTGYNGYDDIFYIRRAFELANGPPTPPGSYFEARIGLVAPTAFAYRAFAVTPFSTVAFPFACSLLAVGAAFFLGARLHGRESALLAALLLAFLPLDVLFASKLYAAAPVTLLGGIAFACFVLAERQGRAGLHFASGLALGLAGVVHEPALMVLVCYPVYVLAAGRVRLRHGLAALGLALGLGLDPLAHALMGDPLARIAALGEARTFRAINEDVAYRGLNAAWLAEPLVRTFTDRKLGLYPWLLAPIILYRCWRPRDRDDRPLALVLAAGFLWIEYGSVSVVDYAPLAREPRYLAPLVLPAIWLLARGLTGLAPRARIVLLGVLLPSSVGLCLLDRGSALPAYQELKSLLDRLRPSAVVVEPRAHFPLAFAEGLRPRYALSKLGEVEPRGAIVVVVSASEAERIEALPGVERLAEFPRADKLYHEWLRTALVRNILRAIRPAARLETYRAAAAPWRLRVYRVP